MAGYVVVDEWISRCASRMTALLPNLGSAVAAERAKQMLHDASHYEPEIAAEVYVRELGPHDVPWDRKIAGEWSVSFDLDDGTEKDFELALTAADALLQGHGVSAHDGWLAKFRLESWDDSGFDERYKLTAKQDADLKVWFDAEGAANAAINGGNLHGERYGHLAALPPSTVRFDEAHKRWRARRGEGAIGPTSQARSLWLDRFAARLGQLQPTLSPTLAWQHAESTFFGASDLQPEEAAEIFAQEQPPGELGAPE